ncbi:MAG: DUF4398 domain-containing protein [Nitrospirota bacterium]
MKRLIVYLLVGLGMFAFIAGCSKQPTQEISDAKAAVDATVADGAEKYATEDLKRLNDSLTAATDEISIQDKKFFKSYTKAKEMLAQVKADAETLKTEIPAKKEKAKNDALTVQTEATTAVADAKALIAKAPRGKGSRADLEAMKADLAGLETSLAEVQTLISSEDYLAASEKAAAIKAKAAEVSDQINQAMEKTGKK